MDLAQLRGFISLTQEDLVDELGLADGPTCCRFLARLERQINKRGVIDVLRNGIKHGHHHVNLHHGTPIPGNTAAVRRR